MVPRGEVLGIDINDDVDNIIRQLRNSRHTRLPVYRGELNDCIGTLHIRNSTRFMGKANLTRAEILQYVRAPYFVPEATPLPAQLIQFQRLRRHFGLVVDEYGDVLGIITLEAILEEIVGKFTSQGSGSQMDIKPQADGSWIVDGSTSIRDINRLLQWQLPIRARTINGLILEELETIPDSALSMRIDNYLIEVLHVRDHAVKSVRIALWDE
jgi:Mg2+/Co2+ transporter CorB